MILRKNGSLSWLEFELLAEVPGLVHGVFSRHGGVSQPPFDALNATFITGDLRQAVVENRRLIQESLRLPSLISMSQVHGDTVMCVDDKEPSSLICDGLITAEKGKGLMAQHADCQAVIFYDPIQRSLAVVHAGWRGLVQEIYKSCIQKMGVEFSSKPQDLLVGISPSLGPSHSEFIHYKTEFPEGFWSFGDASHHFNLWEIARYQLEQCGVLPHHIEVAQICTYANSDYFSYRRNKITGRNATVACLL